MPSFNFDVSKRLQPFLQNTQDMSSGNNPRLSETEDAATSNNPAISKKESAAGYTAGVPVAVAVSGDDPALNSRVAAMFGQPPKI